MECIPNRRLECSYIYRAPTSPSVSPNPRSLLLDPLDHGRCRTGITKKLFRARNAVRIARKKKKKPPAFCKPACGISGPVAGHVERRVREVHVCCWLWSCFFRGWSRWLCLWGGKVGIVGYWDDLKADQVDDIRCVPNTLIKAAASGKIAIMQFGV